MKLLFEKIYCLYCPAFPLRGKVGISGNVEQRRASIEYEIRQKHGQHVRVKCLLKMPIITSAYTFEQALHAAFDRLYFPCKTMRGTNGGSEWWWSVNWVACILAYLIGYAYGWGPLCRVVFASFFLVFPFAPLDLALCVVLLALAEYAVAVGVVWGIFNFLG